MAERLFEYALGQEIILKRSQQFCLHESDIIKVSTLTASQLALLGREAGRNDRRQPSRPGGSNR